MINVFAKKFHLVIYIADSDFDQNELKIVEYTPFVYQDE